MERQGLFNYPSNATSPHGGGKGPYPVNRGQNTLIDFTARDNPKVKNIKVEEIRDDSIVKELDESGFVKSLGLK